MNSPAIAPARVVLAVEGVAHLSAVWRGGVDKARLRVCSKPTLPGLAFPASFWTRSLLVVARCVIAAPLAIVATSRSRWCRGRVATGQFQGQRRHEVGLLQRGVCHHFFQGRVQRFALPRSAPIGFLPQLVLEGNHKVPAWASGHRL